MWSPAGILLSEGLHLMVCRVSDARHGEVGEAGEHRARREERLAVPAITVEAHAKRAVSGTRTAV